MSPKALIRNFAYKFGYDVVKRRPSFVDFMQRHGLTTVLDVGANEGQYVATLRDRGYAGRVLSFEPLRETFSVLKTKAAADARWDAINLGLGDRDEEREIAVSPATVFSSFKRASTYIAEFDPRAAATRHETVRVARLDTFARSNDLDISHIYLKVDTQGFEKEVITGAGILLDDLRAVQLELPVKHLYDGQDGWREMIDYMAERGFHVAMVKESNHDPRTLEVIEFDVVFANDRFINAS